jgi:hypothetical protein
MDRPRRSQAERTGRRDRRPTKFYELRENLSAQLARTSQLRDRLTHRRRPHLPQRPVTDSARRQHRDRTERRMASRQPLRQQPLTRSSARPRGEEHKTKEETRVLTAGAVDKPAGELGLDLSRRPRNSGDATATSSTNCTPCGWRSIRRAAASSASRAPARRARQRRSARPCARRSRRNPPPSAAASVCNPIRTRIGPPASARWLSVAAATAFDAGRTRRTTRHPACRPQRFMFDKGRADSPSMLLRRLPVIIAE